MININKHVVVAAGLVTSFCWMVPALLVICQHTACSRLTLTDVDLTNWLLNTNYSLKLPFSNRFASKATVLSTGSVVVTHKSAEDLIVQNASLVVPSSILVILCCFYDVIEMLQLSCEKHSEIWLVQPTPGQQKSTVWLCISYQAIFFLWMALERG